MAGDQEVASAREDWQAEDDLEEEEQPAEAAQALNPKEAFMAFGVSECAEPMRGAALQVDDEEGDDEPSLTGSKTPPHGS